MASFYGTAEEFDKFLMPRIRNRIQFLARPLKERSGGRCEHCGRSGVALDAAHVHGRERKTIVREVLEKYRTGEGYHIGDLEAFEQEVVDAHEPVDEAFLFLCKDCHRAYDSESKPAQSHKEAPSLQPTVTASVFDTHVAPASEPRTSKKNGSTIQEEFYAYLIDSGYTERTKSGNPGTVYSYKNAVDKVCNWENCSWDELADKIDKVVNEYSPGGIKANFGRQSHNTVINGLRAYGRFCATRQYRQEPRASANSNADVPLRLGCDNRQTGNVLPIKLVPSNQDEFKLAFIESGKAEIREYYADGSTKAKVWTKRASSGFSKTSNVIGNLRSRPEYRAGAWRERGMIRLEVEVIR